MREALVPAFGIPDELVLLLATSDPALSRAAPF
jgi:hypothetical protein